MEAQNTSQRWLFGPAPDLLLGCGLGYLLIVAGFLAAGVQQASIGVLGLVPLISILTGTPHYGATLLRVYEKRGDRRAYAFFAVWVTLVVWAFFYAGLYSFSLGSLILTIYITWSPWHYTGQNYGIAVMFLRRRGVRFTETAKRVLHASFVLSYLLTFLALHGALSTGEYAAVQPYKGGTFQLMRLGIPTPFLDVAVIAVGIAYLVTLAASAWMLSRGGRLRDLVPVGAIALTQAAWFTVPTVARHWELMGPGSPLDTAGTAYAFFWIATGHSVQYLWITTYYAAAKERAPGRIFYLAKTLAAGSFIWSVPGLIYGLSLEGGRLGGVARDLDVFILLAAVVNLHHFILDGAIWKLRDGRVARVLIRRDVEGQRGEPVEPEPRRRWLAPLVYAMGTLATIQVLVSLGERKLNFEPALRAGDVNAAWHSLQRLDTIHADSSSDHLRFGNAAADDQNYRLAAHAYERSLTKRPTPVVWFAIGVTNEDQGQSEQAVLAYEKALELNPDHPHSLVNLGLLWLRLGEPERAVAPLERAVELVPGNPTLEAGLERARKRSARGAAPADDG